MTRPPAWTRRLVYRRAEAPQSGMWLLPAAMLVLGAWLLAMATVGLLR